MKVLMRISTPTLMASASLFAVSLATPAFSQTTAGNPSANTTAAPSDAAAGGDIVVTAQRRRESLQHVPIAAVAVSSTTLIQKNIHDMTDLGMIAPSLKIDTPYGNTAPKITLRGVGSSSFNLNTETTVALYMDEFVLNPVSSKLGELFDVERVEVLRGPQGTLYGKNSTGGAINYITKRPDGSTEADGSVTVGRFGEYDITGGAQTAVTNDLSVRVSLNRRYSDGYEYNSYAHKDVNTVDDWGGRIGFVYKAGSVDAYLKLFADRSHTDGLLIKTYGVNANGSSTSDGTNPITGYTPTNRKDDIASDVTDPHSNVDNRGATLNLNLDLGGVTLTSVSGFLHSTVHILSDQDGSPVNAVLVNFNSSANEVSQELRLASNSNRPFTWIAGASYIHQDQTLSDSYDLPLFGLPDIILNTQEKTTSFAGFADATYHFTDQLSVYGGARLTTDQKSFHHESAFSLVGPFDILEAKRWTKPTYRAGINFQADPRTLLYLSYNHGYRSGEFDISFPTTTAQFKPVNPESVDSFEGGAKASLFDHHLRIAADVFYETFKDQQLLIQGSAPGSICCSLVNAGKSRIYGFEFDASARLTDNFNVNLQGSILRSKYLTFQSGSINYAGNYLSNIPRYQLRIAPEYRIPSGDGAFFVSPDVQFTGSERVSTTIDSYGRDIQGAYTLLNAQAGYRWRADRFSAFFWIRNATDKRYMTDFASYPAFGYNQVLYAAPRTFGITVTGKY